MPQRCRKLATGDPEHAPTLIDKTPAGPYRSTGQVGLQCRLQQLVERFPLPRGPSLGALEQSLLKQRPDLSSHLSASITDLSRLD